MHELPFILSIPHCGADIPASLKPDMALDDDQILESTDFGTRELFGAVPALAVIQARWSRLVVDLNRDPRQRDAKGVVALTDYQGRSVFKSGCEPTPEQVEARVARYHQTYARQLQQALDRPDALLLIDCHSLNGVGPADAPDPGEKRKDIILSNNGDAQGRPRPGQGPVTCPPDLLQTIAQCMTRSGFSVSLNSPYTGGYIVKHYAPPLLETGRSAVQIEMNQDLYMAAGHHEPDARRIAAVRERILQALRAVAIGLGA
jgi:N-formylglutamate deformylase